MDVCCLCGKIKDCSETCVEYKIIIQGNSYSPVRYKAKKYNPFNPQESEMRCPSCNVKPGGLHHIGCVMEKCPSCGGDWIYCQCHGIKQKKDESLKKQSKILHFIEASLKRKKE